MTASDTTGTRMMDEARALIRERVERLEEGDLDAAEQLRAYAGYWERCIIDVSAMLAAELPSLPENLATAVSAHFAELKDWLARVLLLGQQQGSVSLSGAVADEADAFMSAVYGAMLSARAFADPRRYAMIVDTLLSRMVALH